MPRGNQVSYRAAGTIGCCRFVKPDITAASQVLQADADSAPCGISQENMKRPPGLPGSDAAVAAEITDPIMVWAIGDDCLLEYGATVDEGAFLMPDANGKGILATTGKPYGARSLQSGILGTKGRVVVQNGVAL